MMPEVITAIGREIVFPVSFFIAIIVIAWLASKD